MGEETAVQVALADFNDRRTEINNRTTAQHMLISLNITAAGALFGLVITAPASPLLLLLVATISSSLGMFWANHARTISHIGKYLRDYVKPVVDPGRRGPLMHWEVVHDVYENRRWVRVASFGVPVLIVFMLPAWVGWTWAVQEVAERGDGRLWVAAGISLFLNLYSSILLLYAGLLSGGDGSGETADTAAPS